MIQFFVKGQKLTVRTDKIVEGSENYIYAKVSAGGEWDDIAIYAHITQTLPNGVTNTQKIEFINNEIDRFRFPYIVRGIMEICLTGEKFDSSGKATEVITTTPVCIPVLEDPDPRYRDRWKDYYPCTTTD